jgi:16S rRNA (guanine966-N2)-methyltransferase
MRIIAGTHRGRSLISPERDDIRPTSDKIRQAIFNVLQARSLVVDQDVLDTFCGTGALGFEALSQGASRAVFWDSNPASISLAQKNAEKLKLLETSEFRHIDSLNPPPALQIFPLCFLDPPYHKNMVMQAIQALKTSGWIDSGSTLVCEMEVGAAFDHTLGDIVFEKVYGDTQIIILKLK